jgi:hypothetical protein
MVAEALPDPLGAGRARGGRVALPFETAPLLGPQLFLVPSVDPSDGIVRVGAAKLRISPGQKQRAQDTGDPTGDHGEPRRHQ